MKGSVAAQLRYSEAKGKKGKKEKEKKAVQVQWGLLVQNDAVGMVYIHTKNVYIPSWKAV